MADSTSRTLGGFITKAFDPYKRAAQYVDKSLVESFPGYGLARYTGTKLDQIVEEIRTGKRHLTPFDKSVHDWLEEDEKKKEREQEALALDYPSDAKYDIETGTVKEEKEKHHF